MKIVEFIEEIYSDLDNVLLINKITDSRKIKIDNDFVQRLENLTRTINKLS